MPSSKTADLAEASEAAGAAGWRGARLAEAERRGEGRRVRLADRRGRRELAARFLIDATGKSQSLARRLGARRVAADRLVALSAVLPAPEDAEATTPGRGLPLGLVYSARLPSRILAGDEQALGRLAALQEEEYGRYRATWSAYHQIERRWPDEPFWRRRQTLITLDPQSRLVAARRPLAAESWPADLRPLEPADFGAACSQPRAAADIVAAHPRRAEIGDRKLVLGLQWLLAEGSLAILPQPG